MEINIEVTNEELNEIGFDEHELAVHIIDTLDGDIKELPGYMVNVNLNK